MSDWIESRSPAFVAAGLGMLAGLCMFGYGLWSMFATPDTPAPLAIALLIAGSMEWLCCFLAVRRNRLGWSFALSINGVGFPVFLFGAPKLRDGFETSLVLGVVPAMAFLTITILFAISAHEYQDR